MCDSLLKEGEKDWPEVQVKQIIGTLIVNHIANYYYMTSNH